MLPGSYQDTAWNLAQSFATLSQVDAVVMGGSVTGEVSDTLSDIDLYVYSQVPIDKEFRRHLAQETGKDAIIHHTFWEDGDYWVDARTGIEIDVMYRSLEWAEREMESLLREHQASMGYTTCIWHNIRNSRVLFDRHARFQHLKNSVDIPYPEGLKQAIIRKNYPVLHEYPFSYLHQIFLAMKRKDILSVNHRSSEFFAGFFDILFAVNELSHPGEKRMLQYAARCCQYQTPHMEARIERLFQLQHHNNEEFHYEMRQLGDDLKELLQRLDLYPYE